MGRHFRDDRDLPEWPDDKCSSRFLYEVMESEWEENDWIGLYLQVAIVTTDRRDYTYKVCVFLSFFLSLYCFVLGI